MMFSFFESLESRKLLAVDVVINTAERFQEIDGFGTSLAWWVPNHYESEAWRDTYYKDLGSSMLRMDLNIDALPGDDGDFATPVVMVEDLQTNIDAFDFDSVPTKRYGEVAAASAGKKLDSFKLIGSIWTPPHWMKGVEINSSTGAPTTVMPQLVENNNWGYQIMDSAGGSLIDTPDNLQQFGRYVAAYVKGMEQHFGVPLYAISIANEPAFHEPYNSSVYNPALYVKALKAVGSAFEHYGITTKIIGPEDVGVGATSNTAILNRQLKYINAIKADPEAAAMLDLYTIHGYADDGVTDNRSPVMWGNYWNAIKSDGKKSWMSEISGQPNNWTGALTLAATAQDAFVQGNVSAWLYWQMTDGTATNGQTLTSDTNTAAPKYNAAKHFFRYIRPGSVRVGATPSDPAGVYVSAFASDADKRLTSVLVNLSGTAQTVNLSIAGLSVSSFNIAKQSTSAAMWTDIGPVTFVGNVATLTLPAQSILTLQGATKPAAAGGSISGLVFSDANKNGLFDAGDTKLSARKIFLDANSNGKLDTGEKSVFSNASGVYTFTGLAAGTYRVGRADLPAGYYLSTGVQTVSLSTGQNATGKDIGAATGAPPTGTTGSISGTVFSDADKDGVLDAGESKLSARKIYIDANSNGKFDSGEKSVLSSASGVYTFTGLGAGTHRIGRADLPAGYYLSTGVLTVVLGAGQNASGKDIGAASGNGAGSATGSISGILFNDADRDGVIDAGESVLSARKVYIDANKNGKLDADEKSALTSATGVYSFTNLAAGTYRIRRADLPAGYFYTVPASGYYDLLLAAGESYVSRNIGVSSI